MDSELKAKFMEILVIEGWSVGAMRDACVQLGLSSEHHNILFPEGVSGALDFYEQSLDERMMDSLAKLQEVPQKIRAKIALALRMRIVPGHIPSIKAAWRTADMIWRFASDTSADFNYYTKRGLLAGVYIASSKYRKRDNSPGAIDTDKYIEKSLDKVVEFGKLKSKLPKLEDIPIVRYFC